MMIKEVNVVKKMKKAQTPRQRPDYTVGFDKLNTESKRLVFTEPKDETAKSDYHKFQRQTLTAPKNEHKSLTIKLPKVERQTYTAPVSKDAIDNLRGTFTSPSKNIQSTRSAFSDNNLPPITSYYKDHYVPSTLKLCKKCQHFWRYFRTQEITLMAAVAGDTVDLNDVRKTQRRLKVLINVNEVDTPQRYPIRRKPLPPGACYICSHLDLDGRYDHSHSYLFRKGFFNKCQHHPKTPYPTLIESGEGDRPEDVFKFNKQLSDDELKLSVSVRIKSRKERNSDSPVPIYGQTHFDTAVLNGVQLESHLGESSKFQLPSIFAAEDKNMSGQTSLRSSRNSIKSDKRSQYSSRRTGSNSSRQTDTNESWKNNVRNSGSSKNWKNNSRTGSRKSAENWKINPTISDRSWLEADGYVQREMSDEEEVDEGDDEDDNSGSPIRPKTFNGNEEKTKPQEENIRPQSENIVSPSSSRISRPKGAKRSSDFGDEDEGHLKYHHRSNNESLPQDIVSIASREGSTQPSIRSRHNSKLSEPELALIGSQISRRSSEDGERKSSNSSSSFIFERLAGSMANHWCSCQDIDYSLVKCEECLKIGDHEKWCVHARSTSHQGNCPHCGKPIMKTNKRASSMSFRGSQPPSVGKHSQNSEEKHVKFEDDSDETLTNSEKALDRKLSDDVIGSGEGEDDWTTENLYEHGIDPNIHKRAYLKALFELRMSRLSKINELDESWILDRISKPTFSYFKLRPGQQKAYPDGPKSIGLTPDNANLPSVKNSMKHIFGKLKVDDFYPGGKRNPSRVTVTIKREKKQQTMPVHSYDTPL